MNDDEEILEANNFDEDIAELEELEDGKCKEDK